MLDAKMIRTRLANLAFIPRAVPGGSPPEEIVATVTSDSTPEDLGEEFGGDALREITPQEAEELLRVPGLGEFIELSYRRFLGRGPDFRGGLKHALLLKFWPTYSRRRFLKKLSTAEERRNLRNLQLHEQLRCLHRERQALAQKCLAMEQQQKAYEHKNVTIDVERQQLRQRDLDRDDLLRSLGSLPGQHSRLLEQQRNLFERQLTAFERLLDLPEEHGKLLEQMATIAEQLRQIPDLHDRLLERHRLLLDRQAEDEGDRLARVESSYLKLLDGFEQARIEQAGIEQARIEQAGIEQARIEQARIEQARIEQARIEQAGIEQARIEQARIEQARIEQVEPPQMALVRPETTSDELGEVERFVENAFHLILRRAPDHSEAAQCRDRLLAALARVKGDFLDELLGRVSGNAGEALPGPPPSTSPTIHLADESKSCRICGDSLDYKWSLKVLGGRHLAQYHECRGCLSLQVVNPTWLDEAYAEESRPLANNPDQGRFSRNFSAYGTFVALHEAGVVPERPVVLDFGGGYGLLAQMLKSGGYDAWQVDPYVPVPFLAADRCLSTLDDFPEAGFDLIFSLEVLEHLTDPIATLEGLARRLKPEGTLMLSTGIYHPGGHNHQWPYLATEGGQHITFWSHPALVYAAGRLGFSSLGLFPGSEGFFILFSKLGAESLRARLSAALNVLRQADHQGRAVASWDLQAIGYIQVLDDPIVEDLAPGPDSETLSHRGAA
jgi:SAM-dependent methyltransferase